MSNMSYCRFQNTFNDLRDCAEDFAAKLSADEHRARKAMLSDMLDIFEELGIDVDRKEFDDAMERIDEVQAGEVADDEDEEEG